MLGQDLETRRLSGPLNMGDSPTDPQIGTADERLWQMACTVHVAWDERLTDYHFGPGHPLAPMRLELTMQLAHEFGLWTRPGMTVAAPDPATGAQLELMHDARYIAAVRTVSGWADDLGAPGLEAIQFRYARTFGWAPATSRFFLACASVGAGGRGDLAAARAVSSGSAEHGASSRRMQHAMTAVPRVASTTPGDRDRLALGHGAERIAYVDIDAHHGDGVQAAFTPIRGC